MRAQLAGAIDEYSDAGLKISGAADVGDYDWRTINAYGSTSKGGGTNWFHLDQADVIFGYGGASKGGGTTY